MYLLLHCVATSDAWLGIAWHGRAWLNAKKKTLFTVAQSQEHVRGGRAYKLLEQIHYSAIKGRYFLCCSSDG
jgi:hypothetical protein